MEIRKKWYKQTKSRVINITSIKNKNNIFFKKNIKKKREKTKKLLQRKKK